MMDVATTLRNPFDAWLRALGRPAVLAHRGASRAAPENSLAALRLSRELGADGVEFDVQRCGSGELVVFHDRTLARCTGRMGWVSETSLERLRTLSLDRLSRSLGGQVQGERIPTLEEWLEAAPKGLFLNLEVKLDRVADTRLAGDSVQALVKAGRADQAIVSSFHPVALRGAAMETGEVARGMLIDFSRRWRLMGALHLPARPSALHPHHRLVTPRRVARWHSVGLRVIPWTVDDPEQALRCLDAGVDAIITNRPDVIRPLAERY